MSQDLTPQAAERFANLALACVGREYPNKIAHTLNSDADVKPPRELTPAFFGFPNAEFTPKAKAALARSLTAEHMKVEAAYVEAPGRESFERPYGLAWLLQLAAELHEWNSPEAQKWSAAMRPLEEASVRRISAWLNKLSHPVRSGEHSNTAFGLGLMIDYARSTGHHEFERLLAAKTREFYAQDTACPINYEPSGEDFLSPCLAEADVVRRVVHGNEFAQWLAKFLPSTKILEPAVVTDPTDGKLAHLDGLNLSRAWMLEGIASSLSKGDARRAALESLAHRHAESGLKAVTGEHYEGGHWLGSFAVYLVTKRGSVRI